VHERIPRPGLVERLNGALDSGSVLLLASAGCGKTIALEQALAARPGLSAWVRCRPGDGDPGRLLRRILGELSAAAPGAVDPLAERLAAAQERIDVRATAEELVRELDRLLINDIVVVFDDGEHLAAAPESAAVVGEFLNSESPVLRTAVATRTPLPVRVAKVRSTGRLTELGPGDLAFSAEECAELLRQVRGVPVEDEADRLFSATEGWPLGASLGAVHGDVPSLAGTASRRQLFAFLREEVLDRLSGPERQLVINSSVPRELDRGCMEALALPADFPSRLSALGLPLRPVTADESWLAYHPLVREFLLERLEEQPPAVIRGLHAAVAPALAAAGRAEEAIDHWLAAEAWPEALRAIAGAGPGHLHTAPATLQGWLHALPVEPRATPWMLLLQGALDWADGRQAEAVAGLRRAVAGFSEDGDVAGTWLARFSLADPLWITGHPEEVAALADGFDDEAALAAGIAAPAVAVYAAAASGALGRIEECDDLVARLLAHPHSEPLRPLAVVAECYKHLLVGDFGALVAGSEAAIREFERFDPVNRLPVIAAILPLALGDQGRDGTAIARWARVDELARAAQTRAMVKVSAIWQALLHARAGRLGPAQSYLARADTGTDVGWREYAAELARARVAALDGDSVGAVSACDRAVALAAKAPLPDRFQAVVEAVPIMFDAGLATRSVALADDALMLCEETVPGAHGRYVRALLLGLRAWLHHTDGAEEDAAATLRRLWDEAGANRPDVVRREWPLLEGLLWENVSTGALDPDSVMGAIETAWPGGRALLSFTEHPEARVRRSAVAAAAGAGHPDLYKRLADRTRDPDPKVAAAARAATQRLAAHPPPLRFRLLGGFGVRRGSWEADDAAWDRRVAQRLVRYLLVKRGSLVADDVLLEAFWPGVPEDSARKRLRVAVSCARAVLDVPGARSAIEAAERTFALSLRDEDTVDADLFDEAARAALGAPEAERRRLLEHAVALWTGDPLPEERYADWASPWRDSLTARYAEVLRALVAACHAEADLSAATQAARRLVEVDPLDEGARYELMATYARAGRRGQALRQYLECRRVLVDELGVEPARETTELQRRILAGETV
jgi:ATP/maltotriose-dependent transcriptional regulator MalT/DNA-binding SARP family transcriptional activator